MRPATGWGSRNPAERTGVARVAEGLSTSDVAAVARAEDSPSAIVTVTVTVLKITVRLGAYGTPRRPAGS